MLTNCKSVYMLLPGKFFQSAFRTTVPNDGTSKVSEVIAWESSGKSWGGGAELSRRRFQEFFPNGISGRVNFKLFVLWPFSIIKKATWLPSGFDPESIKARPWQSWLQFCCPGSRNCHEICACSCSWILWSSGLKNCSCLKSVELFLNWMHFFTNR